MDGLAATAFLIGLAGGVHCVAMCGGIVSALNLRTPQPVRFSGSGTLAARPWALAPAAGRQLAYSSGRIASYAAAGALAGGVGGIGLLFNEVLPAQVMLLVVANAAVVRLGLYLAGYGTAVLALERAGSVVWRGLQRAGARLGPAETTGQALAVGLAWGWIPCGLVYSALALALVSGGVANGALVMLAFGLGTLPNLLAAGLLAERLRRYVRDPRVRRAAGFAVILLGLIGLARVPGLAEHVKQGVLCLT